MIVLPLRFINAGRSVLTPACASVSTCLAASLGSVSNGGPPAFNTFKMLWCLCVNAGIFVPWITAGGAVVVLMVNNFVIKIFSEMAGTIMPVLPAGRRIEGQSTGITSRLLMQKIGVDDLVANDHNGIYEVFPGYPAAKKFSVSSVSGLPRVTTKLLVSAARVYNLLSNVMDRCVFQYLFIAESVQLCNGGMGRQTIITVVCGTRLITSFSFRFQ